MKENPQLELDRKEPAILERKLRETRIALMNMLRDAEQSKKELEKVKDYTDNIIKSMIDTLIVVDPDAKIKTINKATSDLLGYKEEELIGKPVATIFAEEDTPFKWTRMKKLIEEGSIRDYDMTYKTKSGEKIPVSFSGSVMRDKDDELVGIVGIARDMREIRRLMQKEKELAAVGERVAVIDAMRDSLVVLNLDGEIIFVNPAHLKMFGHKSTDEILGTGFDGVEISGVSGYLEAAEKSNLNLFI